MVQTSAGAVLPSKVAPFEEQFAPLRDLPPNAAAAANASAVDVDFPSSNQEKLRGGELDELVAEWLTMEEERATDDTNKEGKLLRQESREEAVLTEGTMHHDTPHDLFTTDEKNKLKPNTYLVPSIMSKNVGTLHPRFSGQTSCI